MAVLGETEPGSTKRGLQFGGSHWRWRRDVVRFRPRLVGIGKARISLLIHPWLTMKKAAILARLEFWGGAMPFHTPRCHVAGCGDTCLSPWAVALLVVLVATSILAKPLLNSAGVDLNSIVIAPFKMTFGLFLYVCVWLLAVILGITRKHENALWCVVDSAGVPAVAALLLHVGGLVE
jgi:hypothetical protein